PGPPGRAPSCRGCCGGRGITWGRCCGAPGPGDVEGNGCRGPERTWPGRGAVGSGLAAGILGRPGANTAAGGVCGPVAGAAGAPGGAEEAGGAAGCLGSA